MKHNPRSKPLAGDFFIPQIDQYADLGADADLASLNRALLEHIHQDLAADNPLLEVISYHLEAGGQRVRMKMALSAARALELTDALCLNLALACEFLHNASLIHDDIHDRDATRRNKPAIWCAFGTDLAILAGDYLISLAYRCLAESPEPTGPLIMRLHETIALLIEGQTLDIQNSGMETAVSLSRYTDIAKKKSGTLLSLPLELALIASGHSESIGIANQAGSAFAVAYQIMDDVRDLQSDARQDCHNLIHALLNAGHENAVALALTEAQLQCELAIAHSSRLPGQCGRFLAYQAEVMARRLKDMEKMLDT